MEDFFKLLEKAAAAQAKFPDELWGFRVRPGVTFPGIEIFWGNRVARVDPKRVEFNRQNGKLEDFAEHMIRTLRSRPLLPTPPEIYRVQDLLREHYYAVLSMVREAKGEAAADNLEGIVDRKIVKIIENNKISEPGTWRLRWEVLRGLVVKEMAGVRRGRPPKEEQS